MKNKLKLVFIIALLLSLVACNTVKSPDNTQKKNDEKLLVYTTIYPLQYFTDRIGGNHVTTEKVVPPESDAHSVELPIKK
ncbi:metal ABC transporter solute-binding protein, Zn/Mn family [Peribacillus sp. SCS-26]|uniref:metal ABC transporter solute-binding protein, Zn/Mn family n=1 Tax=Paraperibacillus marinus TaxID=3115295 RepID=UPI003905E279